MIIIIRNKYIFQFIYDKITITYRNTSEKSKNLYCHKARKSTGKEIKMGRHGGGSRSGGSHRISSLRRSGGSRSGGSGARTSSKPFAGCYNRSYYDRSGRLHTCHMLIMLAAFGSTLISFGSKDFRES